MIAPLTRHRRTNMTQTSEKTVGEIAAAYPAASRVFEKHHIDYCCGGKRSLIDACRVAGTAAEEILEELAGATGEDRDWNSAPIADLVREIVERHHVWLHSELPLIDHLFALVGHSHAETRRVQRVFSQLKTEIESHMGKEERFLFPAILEMDALRAAGKPIPRPPFGTIRNPITMMEHDHQLAIQYLDEIRDLTYGYDLPEDACHGLRMVYRELEALEADLHRHIHLENNILFPRVADWERV